MNVGLFHHKGYEIHYFITGSPTTGYSASAKIHPSIHLKAIYIPLKLPEHTYLSSLDAEEAIMQLCRNYIDESLIEPTEEIA